MVFFSHFSIRTALQRRDKAARFSHSTPFNKQHSTHHMIFISLHNRSVPFDTTFKKICTQLSQPYEVMELMDSNCYLYYTAATSASSAPFGPFRRPGLLEEPLVASMLST